MKSISKSNESYLFGFQKEMLNFYQKATVGPVRFSYVKKDGDLREALGTLNKDVFIEEGLKQGLSLKTLEKSTKFFEEMLVNVSYFDKDYRGYVPYLDLEKFGIRQFSNKEIYIHD